MSTKRHKSKSTMLGDQFSYLALHCNFAPFELAWQIAQQTSIQFKCEKQPFKNQGVQPHSEHILYFFQGNQQVPRTWLLQNQGTESVLTVSKPPVDFWMVWENEEDLPGGDFWIYTLKDKGLVQMAYLYPLNRSSKITWCFDLPNLIPNNPNV